MFNQSVWKCYRQKWVLEPVSIDDSGRMVTGINKNKLYANIVYTNRCSISHFHTKYYNQALTYLCPVTCAKFNVVIKHLTIYIFHECFIFLFLVIFINLRILKHKIAMHCWITYIKLHHHLSMLELKVSCRIMILLTSKLTWFG